MLTGLYLDVYSLTVTRLDGLAAGAILAVLNVQGRLVRWRGLLAAVGLGATVLVAATGFHFRGIGNVLYLSLKFSLLAAMYAGLVGWVICSPESLFSRCLSVGPLRYVGRVSYGLYAWHPFVFGGLQRVFQGRSAWGELLAAGPVLLLVTCASWYGFERPLPRLKDRFTPERRFTPKAPLKV